MNFLHAYNTKIIQYDLINKFPHKNIKTIPKLKSMTLNFGCKNFNIQKFATTLLALEILTSKKGTLSVSRNANVLLKIQKGQPAGCKVILKGKEVNTFLTKLQLEMLPKLKNFIGFKFNVKASTLSFQFLRNNITLPEFDNQYPLFSNLPNLDIHISTDARNQKELLFLIKSMKFPFFEKKLKASS